MTPGPPGPSESSSVRPERARLFAALELSPAARRALIRWRADPLREVDGLRAVHPDALHVTLCFLGSQPTAEVDAIAAACQAVASEPPVALSFGEVLWLPRRQPRVLAVGLEDQDRSQPLVRLQSALAQTLAAGGWYEPPERPFLGHVTVARVPGAVRVRATPVPPPAPLSFTATRLTLYRSHLGRPEVRYERLATVELAPDERQTLP